MASRCIAVTKSGHRCRNRAPEGSTLCHVHARVPNVPVVADQEDLLPLAAGEEPTCPVLQMDQDRGIAVGQEAAVLAWGWKHVIQLLGQVSEAIPFGPLGCELTVQEVEGAQEELEPTHVLVLRPGEEVGLEQRSVVYDRLRNALAPLGADLCVGRDGCYAAYADADAPRGYDLAAGYSPTDFSFFVRRSRLIIPAARLRPLPTHDFIALLRPVRVFEPQRAAVNYILCWQPLARDLAEYLFHHRVEFSACLLLPEDGPASEAARAYCLFRIERAAGPEASGPRQAGSAPAHILHFAGTLPHCLVLDEALRQTGFDQRPRLLLVEHRHRLPLRAGSVVDLIPADRVVVFSKGDEGQLVFPFRDDFVPVVQLADLPFKPGKAGRSPEWDSRPGLGGGRFQATLRLRRGGPRQATGDAAVLGQEDLASLQSLTYDLTPTLFEELEICIGDKWAFVISAHDAGVEIPLGKPMRRIPTTDIFVPVGTCIVPEVSAAALQQALGVPEGHYTFLYAPGHDLEQPQRFDVAKSDFRRLTRTILPPPELRPVADVLITPQAAPEPPAELVRVPEPPEPVAPEPATDEPDEPPETPVIPVSQIPRSKLSRIIWALRFSPRRSQSPDARAGPE